MMNFRVRLMVRFHPQYGVTLMELMVALAVAAVLLLVGVPTYREVLRTNRIATLTNDFVATLAVARSEAIKRGTRVSVCRSEDTDQELPSCATSANGWEQGWVVFTDAVTYGVVDGNDRKIMVRQPPDYHVTMTGNTTVRDYLSFYPTGMSSVNGTISMTVDGKSRHVIVISSGRVRICTEDDKDDC